MKLKNIIVLFITFSLISCLSVPDQPLIETAKPANTLLPPIATNTLISTRTITPTATETPVPTETFAPVPSERPAGDQISGTYKFDSDDGGFCALRVVLQPFSTSYEEIIAEIFCIQGPPYYGSGYAQPKTILIANNIAVYSTPKEYSDSHIPLATHCHLVFQFDKNKVTVTQLGVDFDCGFEQGVSANGVYKLVDSNLPVLGCLSIFVPCHEQYPIP